MVPTSIVWMPALPRTERGKVDRKLLRRPQRVTRHTQLPSREWDRIVAELWKRALCLEEVGLDDDFSELGGDSLTAIQLLSAVASRFGVALAQDAVLRAPTLQSFARAVEHAYRCQPPARGIVVLRSAGSSRPLFCFASPFGLALSFAALAHRLGDEQPVYAFQPTTSALWSLKEATRIYSAELRMLQPRGPYLLVGCGLGGVLALEVARALEEDGASQVAWLGLIEPDVLVPAAEGGALRLNRWLQHLGLIAQRSRPWRGPASLWYRHGEARTLAAWQALLPQAVHEPCADDCSAGMLHEPHVAELAARILQVAAKRRNSPELVAQELQ